MYSNNQIFRILNIFIIHAMQVMNIIQARHEVIQINGWLIYYDVRNYIQFGAVYDKACLKNTFYLNTNKNNFKCLQWFFNTWTYLNHLDFFETTTLFSFQYSVTVSVDAVVNCNIRGPMATVSNVTTASLPNLYHLQPAGSQLVDSLNCFPIFPPWPFC